MKATDLRIGNIVYYISENDNNEIEKFINKVDGQDLSLMESDDKYLNLHLPIPITDEWLLKSGFKPTYTWMPNIWSHCNGLIGYDSFDNCVRVDQTWLGKMPFLHQLQNLYFVITGKELEINL